QEPDAPLLARFLSMDQRMVDYVLGDGTMDGRLSLFCRISEGTTERGPADEIAETAKRRSDDLIFLLHGPAGCGKKASAAAAAAALGRKLLAADLRLAPPVEAMPWAALRREALLSDAWLYVDHWEVWSSGPAAPILQRELAIPGQPLFIGC